MERKNNIRTIAFYLPQFHQIPENDEWWGEGFTEWTNVRKAKPLFDGHYQPHIPHDDIGYYNLDDIDVIRKQAEMAKEYGISGFCFYHYWFGGKKLLEKPLQNLLKNKDIDLPFCICWANENWTRSWDGRNKEILIAQNHSDDDDVNFINDIIPILKDSRYIRVNNSPLILIYRPGLLPNPKRTMQIWRDEARKSGVYNLNIVCVENFNRGVSIDNFGVDGAVNFQPNFDICLENKILDSPTVCYYDDLIQKDISDIKSNYPKYKCICPGWDNAARRQDGGGVSFIESNSDKFKFWLAESIEYTRSNFTGENRLLFINAWNEWGEGCHLEPDKKHGYSFLTAFKDTMDDMKGISDESFKYRQKIKLNLFSEFFKKIELLEEARLKMRNEVDNLNRNIFDLENELSYIRNSLRWKIPNYFYKIYKNNIKKFINICLKIKHYIILIFLNPKKFTKRILNRYLNVLSYYRENGIISSLLMIFRKILPLSFYNFFYKLYILYYFRGQFSEKDKFMVVFPVINWNSRWQRPQQIISRFAKDGYKIFYLQMAIIDNRNLSFKKKRSGFDFFNFRKIDKNIFEVTLSGEVPFDVYADEISKRNLLFFKHQLLSLFNSFKIKNPIIMIHFPGWSELAFSLKEKIGGMVVFDCMDDHSGFSTAKSWMIEKENSLIKNSDVVFSSSKLLFDRNMAKRSDGIIVKNGTEFHHFNNISRNGELDKYKGPIIGYYGAINDWFDMEIIKYCSQKKPNWNFILIGGTDSKSFEKEKEILDDCKNVFFLGEKKYVDLPGYVGYFDVCVIPFKLIPLTMATNPVKFYEYISSGKPVVSVELPELFPYRDLCYLAKNKEDFLDKLEIALSESDRELVNRRIKLAKENSWDERYKMVKNEIIKFNGKKNES